jgi:hypothetical protein
MVDSPSTIGPDPEKDYSKIGRSILLKRASSGKPTGIPEVTPFRNPLFDYGNQNFPLPPRSPSTPAEKSINDLMQLPPDWDYKTSMLGPRGEQLPDDAIGWTPHATPYYGDGIEGWWKGTVSRLTAPVSYANETIIPEEGTWWQKTLGTLGNLGARFYHAGGEEGGAPSPLTYLTRAVSQIFKSAFVGLEEAEIKTEQVFGVGRAVEERFAEEAGLSAPEYKPFWEGYNPLQEFN